MRGKILSLTRTEVVARALSALTHVPIPPSGSPKDAGGRTIQYSREPGKNGGFDPTAKHCASWTDKKIPTADCVGFALWACGIDRLQPGYDGSRGEWLNCGALWDDAEGDAKFVRFVPDEEAKAGDCLLTKDHIGVIIRPECKNDAHMVLDCSPRHGRHNSAIETGGPWSDACKVIRWKHLTD